ASLSSALERVLEPVQGRPLGELDMLEHAELDASGNAKVVLRLQNPAYRKRSELREQVERAAGAVQGVRSVKLEWHVDPPGRVVGPEDPVPEVKNVVLVLSGKGGVGKSTVASNVALALVRMGARVGLLDADIYGPSIPTMLGITGQPMSDGKKIIPLQRFGLKLMSMGFLLEDARSAVVWRGPMLHGALLQFLKDVDWGKLDYLLLDLPPGTGDVALTLSQRLQSNGALIVTTPQEVALQDVYKAVSMNLKVGIPILGVVENQSYFICDGCNKRHELFGSGGGMKVAEMAGAPLLGQIPLSPSVREWGDAGTPIVEAAPGSPGALAFVEVAERLVEELAGIDGGGVISIDRSGGVNRRLPVMR
ncbi:MAG TPA: Mrp/NBP35 family ATP-binding protein, partial [Polyangiaceae bacterium]